MAFIRGSRKPSLPSRGSGKPVSLRDGTYWIYGLHAVEAALANPRRRLRRLCIADSSYRERPSVKQASIVCELMDAGAMEDLLPEGAVHQKIALQLLPLASWSLEEWLVATKDRPTLRLAALDQLQDPQNLGAIWRLAAAFGIDALLMPDVGSPTENATIAKVASGALELVPSIRVTNLARALTDCKEAGFWTIGMDGHATSSIETLPRFDRAVILLGSEGRGLRPLTARHCDMTVAIPMAPAMESLNVSHAAAIIFHALYRGA